MEAEFLAILEKVRTIKASGFNVSKEHANTLDELSERIEALSRNYFSLEDLNSQHIQLDPMRMETEFDSTTDTMTIRDKSGNVAFSLKLNRADPSVPIQLAGKSDISSFSPRTSEGNKELVALRRELGAGLENFYYNASKIWDLIEKGLLGKKGSEFINVKMVRNKLIEHTEHGDIFSFGASEAWGPSVKPMQMTSRKERFHDKGLRVNTKELLQRIQDRLNKL